MAGWHKRYETAREHFEAKVNRDGPTPTGHAEYEGLGPCWLWPYSSFLMTAAMKTNPDKLWGHQRMQLHRVSYWLHHGPISEGKVVRHKCDNGKCCNPSHLVIGTQADNMADKHRRGPGNRRERVLDAESVSLMRDLVDAGCPPTALCRLVARITDQHVSSVARRMYQSVEATIGRPRPKRVKAPDITRSEMEAVRDALIAGAGEVSLRAAVMAYAPGRNDTAVQHKLLKVIGWDYDAFRAAYEAGVAAKVIALWNAGHSVNSIYLTSGIGNPRARRILVDAGIDPKLRSPLRTAVVKFLQDGPRHYVDIAAYVDRDPKPFTSVIYQMFKAGVIIRTGRGIYELPGDHATLSQEAP